MAFWWNVKHDGISSNEPLERLGVQVKLNNVGSLGQQSSPADPEGAVATLAESSSHWPVKKYTVKRFREAPVNQHKSGAETPLLAPLVILSKQLIFTPSASLLKVR